MKSCLALFKRQKNILSLWLAENTRNRLSSSPVSWCNNELNHIDKMSLPRTLEKQVIGDRASDTPRFLVVPKLQTRISTKTMDLLERKIARFVAPQISFLFNLHQSKFKRNSQRILISLCIYACCGRDIVAQLPWLVLIDSIISLVIELGMSTSS